MRRAKLLVAPSLVIVKSSRAYSDLTLFRRSQKVDTCEAEESRSWLLVINFYTLCLHASLSSTGANLFDLTD